MVSGGRGRGAPQRPHHRPSAAADHRASDSDGAPVPAAREDGDAALKGFDHWKVSRPPVRVDSEARRGRVPRRASRGPAASPPFAFGFEGGFTGGSSGSSVFLSPGETPSAPSRTWLPKLSPCRHPPAPGNVSLPPARFKGFLFVTGFEQFTPTGVEPPGVGPPSVPCWGPTRLHGLPRAPRTRGRAAVRVCRAHLQGGPRWLCPPPAFVSVPVAGSVCRKSLTFTLQR